MAIEDLLVKFVQPGDGLSLMMRILIEQLEEEQRIREQLIADREKEMERMQHFIWLIWMIEADQVAGCCEVNHFTDADRRLSVVNELVLIVGGIELHPGPITPILRKYILEEFTAAQEDYMAVLKQDKERYKIGKARDAFEVLISINYSLMYELNNTGLKDVKTVDHRNGKEHPLLNHGWWIEKNEMLKHFTDAPQIQVNSVQSMMDRIINLIRDFSIKRPELVRGSAPNIDVREEKFQPRSMLSLVEEMFHVTKELFVERIAVEGGDISTKDIPCVCGECRPDLMAITEVQLIMEKISTMDKENLRRMGYDLKRMNRYHPY